MTYIGRSSPGHTPVTVKKNGSLSTSTDNAIGTMMPGIRLWGHRINLAGDDGISCEECGMEEEIPDLLQMTNGFREVVYKMYILGKFKYTRCESEYETDNSSLHTRTTNVGFQPNWTTMNAGQTMNKSVAEYVPQNQRIVVDGEEWEHDGYGRWHSHDTGKIYSSDEMAHHYGQNFTALLGTAPQTNDWPDPRDAGVGGGVTYTLGDMSMGKTDGLRDTSTSTSVNVDVDDDLDEEVKQSLKEKFVSALSSGKTTLR